MPHKNYCQQCGKSVSNPRFHDKKHTIIPDVADRSTYPIIKAEPLPVIKPEPLPVIKPEPLPVIKPEPPPVGEIDPLDSL